MEKTLKKIQGFAKLGKILSRIVFVFCIVGIVFCLIGIAGVAFLPEEVMVGSVSITGVATVSEEVTKGMVYAALAAIIVACIGELIVSARAVSYFKYELETGTPFTLKGAKKLKNLGILSIVLPIVFMILSEVVFMVVASELSGISEFNLHETVSIGSGIGMILVSLILKYGAELTEKKETPYEL